jgi:hypothetical protein
VSGARQRVNAAMPLTNKLTCYEANSMAASNSKRELYRLTLLLNSSLNFIATRLDEMNRNKIFNPEYIQQTLALTKKVETEITSLLPSLEAKIENDLK